MNFFKRLHRRRRPSLDQSTIDIVSASGLFDAAWYAWKYPETCAFSAGLVAHFCQYGMHEHKDPGPDFSTIKYLSSVPEAATADIAPFLHALSTNPHGAGEGVWRPDDLESFEDLIRWSGLFDEKWYLDRHQDVARAGLRPLRHFAEYGAAERRDPSRSFDSEHYAERYPHYSETYRSPIEHYIRVGRRQGYEATGMPVYERWITAHDTLASSDLERIRSDAARASLPPIAILQLVGPRDCGRIGLVLEAMKALIGPRVSTHFLRGADVSDEAWTVCQTTADGQAHEFHPRSSDLLANLAAGTIVVLCGEAILLRPHAAYVLASTLVRFGAEAAYADHDCIAADRTRNGPIFKPAMSPEFMRRLPYAGQVVAIALTDGNRPRMIAAVSAASGGATLGGDAQAQWADLLLGFAPERVLGIPFILYHRLEEAPDNPLATYEPVGERSSPSRPTRPAPSSDALASVRIVIPTRDRVALLRACIDSILAGTDYPASRYEIAIVDNGSVEATTQAYLRELSHASNVTVIASPGRFNFSKLCNDGAAGASRDVLVFLNNDMTVKQSDWLSKLVDYAGRPGIGTVGAQLLYPDDTVQHGGVVLGVNGVGAHRMVRAEAGTAFETDVTREMVAVTGACLAIRRELFVQLGGFDPVLAVAFNDVKLCASAHAAGYRNIYVGEPLFYHHESQSRGSEDSREKIARNHREAIYIRERYGALFQNDPSYSRNLSLKKIGAAAFPPRVVRPWRRSTEGRKRVLFLSGLHAIGHGIPVVLSQQAEFLRARGWEVLVGGPESENEIAYPGCRRIALSTAQQAADLAVSEGIDCVVAHTPPFFSIVSLMGQRPLVYFVDHGEPPPNLFPDRDRREDVDWEKRFCVPLARRVFTVSQTIYGQQFRRDAVIVRNGNSQLATWSDAWASRRPELRRKLGLEGRFVILNVCRFEKTEQYYKGIERYVTMALEAPFAHPGLKERAVFVLAGRGGPEDVAYIRSLGLTVYANPTEAEIAELYAASDLYLNLSQWEGYNLGIGQARAMGLDAIASDIDAHREFGIETSNNIPELCAMLAQRLDAWDEQARGRTTIVEPWDEPLTLFADLIESDLAEDAQGAWY